MDVVVGSDTNVYEDLVTRDPNARLGLQDAVKLQPLTRQQIDVCLERAGDELDGLRTVLRGDETLQDI